MQGDFSNLLIYAGFPKTASRWLLANLWDAPSSGFELVGSMDAVARDFILNNPFDFNPHEPRKCYGNLISAAVERGLIPVLHHEGISAQLFTPAPPDPRPFEQIKATFPGCRVIIAVREQRRMLLSWYTHNVKLGLGVPPTKYLTETAPGITPFFRYDVFEYHKIVAYLYSLYGKDRVLVIPYEMLRADRDQYLATIYKFSGVERKNFSPVESEVNVGLRPAETSMIAWLNKWFASDWPRPRPSSRLRNRLVRGTRYMCRFFPDGVDDRIKKHAEKAVEDAIQDRYQKSNRALQELTGIKLSQYGYDL
ncbi:sulfotransferase [Desulfurivibrio sp. D14AmB]|uniref:sulfotransferase n=1 Tax=Desulfurivibrio sp. D14AmB TaxID=3374370 RepID=UPI00376F177E